MTYTDDDVAAGSAAYARGLLGGSFGSGSDWDGSVARAILDAVAPAIAARALREAADEWGAMRRGNNTPDGEAWLRARAEGVME